MNLTDIQLALRAQALTLSSVTTGSATLSATATGYARAAGSFATDGFLPGMEVLPAGYTTNTPQLVTAVAALALTVRNTLTAEAAAGSRSLTVGLPSLRGWDNQRVTTVRDRWAVEEEFLVQPQRLLTLAGSGGTVWRKGLYVLRLYIPTGCGMAAGSRVADDLLALYTPESTLAVTGGDTVRVQGEVGPSRSGFLPGPAGFAALALTVPWYALMLNS